MNLNIEPVYDNFLCMKGEFGGVSYYMTTLPLDKVADSNIYKLELKQNVKKVVVDEIGVSPKELIKRFFEISFFKDWIKILEENNITPKTI